MKIGGSFLLQRVRRAFADAPKTLLLLLESSGVRARFAERSASVTDRSLGSFRLLFCPPLGCAERLDAEAPTDAVELGAREIVSTLDSLLQACPRGIGLASGSRFGLRPLPTRFIEGRFLAQCSPFGLAEVVGATIDPFAPERHERLEGIALFHPSFVSGVA